MSRPCGTNYGQDERYRTEAFLPKTRERAHSKRMDDLKALAARFPVATMVGGRFVANPPGRVAALLKRAEEKGASSDEFIHMMFRLHHAWNSFVRANERRGIPIKKLRIFANQLLLIRELAGDL